MRTRRVGRPRTGRGCGAGTSTGQGAGRPGSVLGWQWLRLLSGHRRLLGITWSVAPGFLGCFQQGVGQAPTLSFFSAVEQGTYIFILHWATFSPQLRRSILLPVSSPLEKAWWGGKQEGGPAPKRLCEGRSLALGSQQQPTQPTNGLIPWRGQQDGFTTVCTRWSLFLESWGRDSSVLGMGKAWAPEACT